jgi:hypothetical protein
MSKVMVSIQSRESPPQFEEVKTRYGLTDDEIDPQFGVVEIDPVDGTYAILVEETAAEKITDRPGWTVQGPYSNPTIEPFGPPQVDE